MKIILSRKGFDSSYGGYPSPILPDGRLLSLPIPARSSLCYNDINIAPNSGLLEVMQQLCSNISLNGKQNKLTNKTECHLDPDIYPGSIQRATTWKPLFGQCNSAQSHLFGRGVTVGDLFLFFGWFRQTEYKGERLIYSPKAPAIHCIWGYLQIGRIYSVYLQREQINNGIYHPHLEPEYESLKDNTLYEASDSLTFNPDKPGAGVFEFSPSLVLTKKGMSRSKWELPESFRSLNISIHTETKSRGWKDNFFQSAHIGQEFVIEDSDVSENWAKDLIENNRVI